MLTNARGSCRAKSRGGKRTGPDLNRDAVGNVQKAGFRIRREENVYLDIIKIIEAVKDPA